MSCDGHDTHVFRADDPECEWCGHPRSEHPGDQWRDNRGKPTVAHTAENDPMGLYDDEWEPVG